MVELVILYLFSNKRGKYISSLYKTIVDLAMLLMCEGKRNLLKEESQAKTFVLFFAPGF
jgi:hypothetical protein